jgi:hypothetical protein
MTVKLAIPRGRLRSLPGPFNSNINIRVSSGEIMSGSGVILKSKTSRQCSVITSSSDIVKNSFIWCFSLSSCHPINSSIVSLILARSPSKFYVLRATPPRQSFIENVTFFASPSAPTWNSLSQYYALYMFKCLPNLHSGGRGRAGRQTYVIGILKPDCIGSSANGRAERQTYVIGILKPDCIWSSANANPSIIFLDMSDK